MDTEWEAILTSYRELRRLYRDVSALLKAFQGMAGDRGWLPEGDSTCLADHSDSLNTPERWLPYYAFRVFKSSNCANVLSFVSVILDYWKSPELAHFHRPLVTCGLYVFDDLVPEMRLSWPHRLCLHLYTSDRDYGGAFFTTKSEFFDAVGAPIPGLVHARTMARPLESITSTDDLQRLILEPLLVEIERHAKRALENTTRTEKGT